MLFSMNGVTLASLCRLRKLRQSDVARAVNVSRQAVSLWFKAKGDEVVHLKAVHALRLADVFGVDVRVLLQGLPLLADEKAEKLLEASLNWDRMFPGGLEVISAANRGDLRAISRVVLAFGMFEAAHAFGKKVWTRFHRYKKFLPIPLQRNCEILWKTQKQLEFI